MRIARNWLSAGVTQVRFIWQMAETGRSADDKTSLVLKERVKDKCRVQKRRRSAERSSPERKAAVARGDQYKTERGGPGPSNQAPPDK